MINSRIFSILIILIFFNSPLCKAIEQSLEEDIAIKEVGAFPPKNQMAALCDEFGYIWTVSFIGGKIIGKVDFRRKNTCQYQLWEVKGDFTETEFTMSATNPGDPNFCEKLTYKGEIFSDEKVLIGTYYCDQLQTGGIALTICGLVRKIFDLQYGEDLPPFKKSKNKPAEDSKTPE